MIQHTDGASYMIQHTESDGVPYMIQHTDGTPPPSKYINQNTHYHVRTEYILGGFVVDIKLRWQLTERE